MFVRFTTLPFTSQPQTTQTEAEALQKNTPLFKHSLSTEKPSITSELSKYSVILLLLFSVLIRRKNQDASGTEQEKLDSKLPKN